MKTNKQMLEDVVMVKELLEETELPDMDNKKMPCYKFSGHQMIDNDSSIYWSPRLTSSAPKQCRCRRELEFVSY